jgi:hypothetical protein
LDVILVAEPATKPASMDSRVESAFPFLGEEVKIAERDFS